MATLLHLAEAGLIQKVDAALDPWDLEERRLYAAPRWAQWIEDTLPYLQADQSEISPIEELDDLFAHFCSGGTLAHGRQFHCLIHRRHGVWELKTRDLRVFGWFPSKDCFVGASADMAKHVKENGLYSRHRQEVVSFRNQLDLDPPKFISGDDPNAVITAFSRS
jgi:hypothetical protein